jgi:hypothetical protein
VTSRMSKPVLLIIITVLLFLCSQAGWSETPAPPEENTAVIQPSAQEQTSIRFGYQRVDVFADQIRWNRLRNEVVASGNIRVVSDDRLLFGDKMDLNLEEQTGEITAAQAQYHNLWLSAKKLEMRSDEIIAQDAFITTCSLEKPHYRISAHSVVLHQTGKDDPNAAQRIDLKGATFMFGNRRIFSLPPLHLSRGSTQPREETALPLPYPGYSKQDGPFLSLRWNNTWFNNKVNVNVETRATTERGLRTFGYTRYTLPSKDFLELVLSRKEDLSDRVVGVREINTGLSHVLVDRLPELSYYALTRPLVNKVHWDGQLSTGEYREEPDNARGVRTAATGRIVFGAYPLTTRMNITDALAYRRSFYDNGDEYGVLYNRLTLDMKPKRDWDLAISYIRRHPSGETPFRFDRVEIAKSLALESSFPINSRWRGKFMEIYDVERHKNRDVGVWLIYRAHCLDYTLGWRERRQLFEFGVNLANWASE